MSQGRVQPGIESAQQDNTLLHLSVSDETSLAAAYMPFIDGGGLFVQTSKDLAMGAEVFLSLRLLEDPQDILIAGKVVWINSVQANEKGTTGPRPPGIGVQFPQSSKQLKLRIENLLPDCAESSAESLTL